ncbi:MAG: sugar phosphate isomerase/epimerase [Phycisphaerales bacterium]|nr:sugar phosphate isomerase/epimerase [Phycisphaerales bacterium]
MKLAFSTNAYTLHSLVEAIEGIAVAGFDGVEILADAPHLWPPSADAKQIATIRRQLERLKLQVSNLNANCSFGYWKDAPPEPYFEPSLISPNPRHRADRIRLICRTLELAHELGSANVSITSGRMLGGMPPEKAAKQFIESIKPILDLAGRLKIDLGIECEPGLFIEYVSELRDWIERLNHPRLGANLDAGHCQVIGEEIPQAIDTLRGRIWNLHVEDIPGRKHYHLIPGQGTMNWPALVGALREIEFNRFMTVELYTCTQDPQGAALESYRFLAQLVHGHG